MNRIYDSFVALGDLFMPRACLACGRRLGMRERHLCLSCAADVPYTRFWLAAHNPLADRFNAVLERHRGTEPMDYAYAAALIYYKGAYRSIPRALKYQGDLAAGRHYGALLGRRLAAAPHFVDIDLVIPVPLHWTRLRSRGYNQAEILARALVSAYRSAAPLAAPPLAAPSAAVPSTTSVSGPSERRPVAVGHDDGAVPAAPAPTSSSGTSERWPVAAGHDDWVAPTIVSSGVPSTVIPGWPRNIPEVRTDLLVRARRTRTQTRVSVDQKARNVASAFQVPECFPLWARLTSRLARVFSSLLARWPIGVGHDGNHLSSQDENRLSRHDDNHLSSQDENRLSRHDGNHLSGQDEDRLSGHNDNHLSSQDENRLSRHDENRLSGHEGNHLSKQDENRVSRHDENRLSGHDGNHLSDQDENRLSECDGIRHSRLDRESPAAVLASAHHILLVDDTYTTGATLYACYAALRPYTTARISIATLAAVEGSPSSGP
jgi:predicted amidophosphoribosyltransferase